MRLVIDEGGYAAAADAFVTANQVIGLAAESLAGKVSGYAAMAGDDASSHDFADAYDTTATTALTTLAELTDSFASLAHLMAASGWNHATAEADATINGPGHGPVDGSGPGAAPALDTMSFTPPTLPSAAGGTTAELSNLKGWIVEHVQGFAWPNADTDTLREAANTWRHLATAVDDLPAYCRTAADHLALQVSPEIPLALDVIADLKDLTDDTHTQVLALAQACDDYADQVENARELLHAVLDEILTMVLEGAVISGLLAGLSGGIAAAGGAAAISAKIATKAPQLHAITTSLITTATTTAATARTAGHTLTHTQTKLARYARAKAALRNERGYISLGGAGGAVGGGFFKSVGKKGWLDAHEAGKKGHTKASHVGKTDSELMARFSEKSTMQHSSTYFDQDGAERHIADAIDSEASQIRQWLASGDDGKHTITRPAPADVGRILTRDGDPVEPRGIQTILIPDKDMPDGFRVLTSYPIP